MIRTKLARLLAEIKPRKIWDFFPLLGLSRSILVRSENVRRIQIPRRGAHFRLYMCLLNVNTHRVKPERPVVRIEIFDQNRADRSVFISLGLLTFRGRTYRQKWSSWGKNSSSIGPLDRDPVLNEIAQSKHEGKPRGAKNVWFCVSLRLALSRSGMHLDQEG